MNPRGTPETLTPFPKGHAIRSKLTPEAHRVVIEALQGCAPPNVAAALAGVTERTIERWAKRGRRTDARAEERKFYEDFISATAGAEYKLIQRVRADAEVDVGSAQWMLQKHPVFRLNWNERHQVDVTSGGKPLPAPVHQTNVQVNAHSTAVDARSMSLEDLRLLHSLDIKYAALARSAEPGVLPAGNGRATAPESAREDAGAPSTG